MRIFLSHSSIDKPFVEKLARDLFKLNIDVWLDKWEIKVGDSLIDKISIGLSESDYLIVVLSKNSVLSNWVTKELNYSLIEEISKQEVKILPIIIDNCDIPIFLKEKLYADFRNDYQSGLNTLIEAISPSFCEQNIFVNQIDFLESKTKNSLCMEIEIINNSKKEIWLKKLDINSTTEKHEYSGIMPSMHIASYKVELDCFYKIKDRCYDIFGYVFEGNEENYAKMVEGNFNYHDSSGYISRNIQLTIPIRVRVFAKDRLCLRIVLLKPSMKLLKKLDNEEARERREQFDYFRYNRNVGNSLQVALYSDDEKATTLKFENKESSYRIIEFITNYKKSRLIH